MTPSDTLRARNRRDAASIAQGGALHEAVRVDGEKLDADLTGRLTSATLVRTMDGAESIELAVADPRMELLRSGVLTRTGRPNRRAARIEGFDQAAWERFATALLTLDGARFRLAGADWIYDANTQQITITFEAEIAALMRQQTRAYKNSRGTVTRAEVIHQLAFHAMGAFGQTSTFGYFSPQAGQRQPIAEPDDQARRKGLHPDKHLTVNGTQANDEQRRNMQTALRESDDLKAPELAVLAMLVAGIGESSFQAIPNAQGSNYWGVFQGSKDVFALTDTKGMARSFLLGGRGFQAGGAIKQATTNPDAEPGDIATKVEASGEPGSFYQRFITEATAILDAWGGAGKTYTLRERFEFRAGGRHEGKHENYWDASGRLADQVRWRRFASENILYFLPDEWLFTRRPTFVLNGGVPLVEQGLVSFTGHADVGMPTAELLLVAEAPRWTVPPGCVIELEDMGPATGKWLTWEVRHDLFAPNDRAEITLRRPAPTRKEPAPTVTTRVETLEGGLRARIIAEARKTLTSRTGYRYYSQPGKLTTDPTPPTQPAGAYRSDCSQWVRAIYLKAGAEDPGTWTNQQAARGTRTSTPRQGDLVFNASTSHVEIYTGDGKTLGHGSPPIDEGRVESAPFGPGHFYVSFDFLDDT